ncbi:unnamed protein product [Camellia sinensis]
MAAKLAFTLTTPRLFTSHLRKSSVSLSSSSSSSSFSRVHSVPLVGRHFCFRRTLLILPPKATTDQPGQVQADEEVDSKILPYCSIDEKGKKSLGELEQEFLQALQSFYYEGKAIMSNEEFDNLKEELMWEGSSVVMLSSDEQKFLEASMAYVAGKPIMSDQEYDKLKIQLKIDGSDIVVEGPRCSLRSRKVYSDLSVDYLKMVLLNVPAAIVALGLFFFLDDLTGFEITYLLELPEPFSFIFTWFAALPLLLWALVQTVGQKTSPFLEPSYQYPAVVPPTPSNAQRGACGYGNLMNNGYGTDTAALSSTLFNDGYACGTCYQMKCVQSPWCYAGSPFTTVKATNLCPPNWSQDSNNGGWCNPPRSHFDMSKPAFMKIAQWKAGIVPVMYRRVPCIRTGGLRFSFQGNGYWLLVYVMNVAGGGDIASMWVKGSSTGWISMSHNWGASYQAFATLSGQPLSFKITSYTTKETIVAYNVAPSTWSVGLTYQANVNFH